MDQNLTEYVLNDQTYIDQVKLKNQSACETWPVVLQDEKIF
jgi:hypothetical protein